MRVDKKVFTGYTFPKGTVFKSCLEYKPLYDSPPIVYRDLGEHLFMDIGGKFHYKSEIKYIKLNTLRLNILWFIKNII